MTMWKRVSILVCEVEINGPCHGDKQYNKDGDKENKRQPWCALPTSPTPPTTPTFLRGLLFFPH